MQPNFNEKMHWVTIIALVVIYGLYFSLVLPPRSPDVSPEHIVLFLVLLVPLVLIFVAGAVVSVMTGRKGDYLDDERDRLIELKGIRNSAYVLGTGVFVSIICALFIDGNFWFIHVLFGFLVLAELVEAASRIAYYRLGV